MAKKITIDDLYSDAGIFNEEAILYTLKDKIIFTREDEIVFITDLTNLKAQNQILLYALAKKILKVNQKIENEIVTIAEIADKTKINRNTIRGALKLLKDKNILIRSQSGYEIPAFRIEEVLRLLTENN